MVVVFFRTDETHGNLRDTEGFPSKPNEREGWGTGLSSAAEHRFGCYHAVPLLGCPTTMKELAAIDAAANLPGLRAAWVGSVASSKGPPNEANLSAESNPSSAKTRFQGPNEYEERSRNLEAPTGKGSKAARSREFFEVANDR